MLVGAAAILGSEMVLSPVVSGCLPSCGGRVLVGVATSRTETFRDQNHRLQSKFAYCKLFGVYAGVILQNIFFWVADGCFSFFNSIFYGSFKGTHFAERNRQD